MSSDKRGAGMATTDKDIDRSSQMMRSPAADRNKDAILSVLKQLLVPTTTPLKALEIASGTGQHSSFFAKELSHVTWQPSECDERSLQSIHAYLRSSELCTNLEAALTIDVTEQPNKWASGNLQPEAFDLLLCVNMIHIAPWEAAEGLFRGAGHYLKPNGMLLTYGPYAMHGEIAPNSNVQFDSMLRQQNPEWGLRDTDDLEKLAGDNSLELEKKIAMPTNNHTLVFRKKGS